MTSYLMVANVWVEADTHAQACQKAQEILEDAFARSDVLSVQAEAPEPSEVPA